MIIFFLLLFSIFLLCCTKSYPQDTATKNTQHPVIGSKSASDLLNSDLLALSDKERQAWVNGAVNMASQILVIDRPETAGCVANWYVRGGSGQEKLEEVMRQYPDQRATSTVFAVARLACEEL